MKEYREKNKERVKIKERGYARKRIKKHPQKIIARNKARQIKIPKNQICEECKIKKATEKHHEDYDKPLEIKFLCRKCHNKTKWKE